MCECDCNEGADMPLTDRMREVRFCNIVRDRATGELIENAGTLTIYDGLLVGVERAQQTKQFDI